jgi:hypothetical protein
MDRNQTSPLMGIWSNKFCHRAIQPDEMCYASGLGSFEFEFDHCRSRMKDNPKVTHQEYFSFCVSKPLNRITTLFVIQPPTRIQRISVKRYIEIQKKKNTEIHLVTVNTGHH